LVHSETSLWLPPEKSNTKAFLGHTPFISLTYDQGICGLSVEYTKYFDWVTFSGCREGAIP
jgi:hypothetical protein